MAKNTCLDCKYYRPKKREIDGVEAICDGVYVPKEKVIEHHCTKNPTVFTKWWDENNQKRREDITEIPSCLELNDHLAKLDKMIQLSEDLLKKLNKK